MKIIQNLLKLFGYAGGITASITEEQLMAMLARNPGLKAIDHSTFRKISASEPEPGTANALDRVVPGKDESKASIIVRFVFGRARLLDVDAVAGGSKDLLDGLQEAGLIPGDRPDQIIFEASQKKVRSKKDEGTLIEIEIP